MGISDIVCHSLSHVRQNRGDSPETPTDSKQGHNTRCDESEASLHSVKSHELHRVPDVPCGTAGLSPITLQVEIFTYWDGVLGSLYGIAVPTPSCGGYNQLVTDPQT